MRPGPAADHSPPSSAAVMEEQSYTSTHPLGLTGPVIGITLPFKSTATCFEVYISCSWGFVLLHTYLLHDAESFLRS